MVHAQKPGNTIAFHLNDHAIIF